MSAPLKNKHEVTDSLNSSGVTAYDGWSLPHGLKRIFCSQLRAGELCVCIKRGVPLAIPLPVDLLGQCVTSVWGVLSLHGSHVPTRVMALLLGSYIPVLKLRSIFDIVLIVW